MRLRLQRRTSAVSFTLIGRSSPRTSMVVSLMTACCIHIACLMLFQINTRYTDRPSTHAPAIIVETTFPTDASIPMEDTSSALAQRLCLSSSPWDPSLRSYQPHHTAGTQSLCPEVYILPWTDSGLLTDHTHRNVHAYPITITTSEELQSIPLIEDGSQMFIEASPTSWLASRNCAEVQPKMDLRVDICPISGRVCRAICVRELTDKRLTEIAWRLVHSLRWSTDGSTPHSGEIIIQFAGSFETIASLINWDMFHDRALS